MKSFWLVNFVKEKVWGVLLVTTEGNNRSVGFMTGYYHQRKHSSILRR